jgi:hypothetical protein
MEDPEIARLLVAKDYERAQAVSFIVDAIENETDVLRVSRLKWVRTYIIQDHRKSWFHRVASWWG